MVVVYAFVVGDLLHRGHINLLRQAKELGDKLIVGVLTDEAVESYKRTPIQSYEERFLILSSIKLVDLTVTQTSRSPLENIKKYKPDIVVHGDDWKSNFPDEEEIRKLSKLVFVPYYKGQSTTEIINKIKQQY